LSAFGSNWRKTEKFYKVVEKKYKKKTIIKSENEKKLFKIKQIKSNLE
jgi:hypothetical protein